MSVIPDKFLRALGDSTRLRILMLLSENRELCVCDLVDSLDMSQPKISRHLAILRENGVVLDRRDGLWIHYRIHPELPVWAFRALEALRDGCEGKNPYKGDQKRLSAMKDRTEARCRYDTSEIA